MYSKFLRAVDKSQTLLLNEQSRNLESQGKEVYKFGFGQSPFLPPQTVIDELKNNAHCKAYSSVQGLLELRQAVATFHREMEGLDYKADNILVAPGSKILIYAVMAAFKKADVLVPAPAWVSYVPQAHLNGHAVIPVQTTFNERWRVTPQVLEAALKTKANMDVPSILILNYPGNPDGLTYSKGELEDLTKVLRKYNVLVVSDEIYGLLDHTGDHYSLAHSYPEGTIITTGLSKWCGAGGWRLGLALLPEALSGDFKECLLGIASETYSCAALPVQMAAISAYQATPEVRGYIAHQRRILSMSGNEIWKRLNAGGIAVHAPQGGFYLFLDFNSCRESFDNVATSPELCEKLLAETCVALLPGTAFGMAPNHLSARLAYVEFDGVAAMKESVRLGLDTPLPQNFLDNFCAKQMRGIDKICEFAGATQPQKKMEVA